jgi:transcriptional regulator
MSNKEPSKAEVMRGTLDLMVLQTLASLGPQHGYAIGARIEQVSSGTLTLNMGTLYPGLMRLEQQGLVKGEWGVTENNRQARFYAITAAGTKAAHRRAEGVGSDGECHANAPRGSGVTPPAILSTLREWTRRVWGALSGRRTDRDIERELAGHIALAEDELRRRGHAPREAARLARVNAGGLTQAVEAIRDQRGLPWLASSWLDIKLGLRLLVRNWGLTLVGGLAMTVAIAIAAVVFTAFDVLLWSSLPIDEGDRVVAIQMWDPKAGAVRDTAWQDVERWGSTMRSVEDVGAFQTIRRNAITADGSVELVSVAEISAAGFRVARVPPLMGRTLVEADTEPGAAPVIIIGHDVWKSRFGGASDVVGRELRLGEKAHTIVGVMPEGFQFPFNFRYWVPLRLEAHEMLRDAGPEGVVFGRLAPDATLAGAHAEVSALGLLPSSPTRPNTESAGARVVPYTFAFTGNFERGELGVAWSLSSLALLLLLLPPCANIAILNYARTVTRQQEFAARHALGGSRARIVCQLFIEALVLSAAAAMVALLILHVVSIVMAGRPAEHPRRSAVLDDLRRVVPHSPLRRLVGGGWGHCLGPCTGASGHRATGAARQWRARRTDRPAARRDVDHAGRRSGCLFRGCAAARRRTGMGDVANRRGRSGLSRRRVRDRAGRA